MSDKYYGNGNRRAVRQEMPGGDGGCGCRCNGDGGGNAYPCIRGTTKNIRLAREVARLRCGELNAISEYMYQSIVFGEALPELTEIFDGIGEQEMHHHRMLGELILALGGDPAERAAVRNSGGIDLSEDRPCRAPVAATRVLRANIADEKSAAAEYRRVADMAERCGQLPAASLLRRIAADEDIHAARQERLLT